MKILAIETSCDETAVAVVDGKGELFSTDFKVLGNSLFSQVDLHREYGGVYPNLARREHSKNLIPLLVNSIKEAGLYNLKKSPSPLNKELEDKIINILSKEPDLLKLFLEIIPTMEKPDIDLLAFTEGPGLAPALWVGVSFVDALRETWNIPALPINHMEGHIWSVIFNTKNPPIFPLIALLVSGGHTEIVYAKDFGDYKILGKTRDDAVGEAYDKVARLLGLPYPGGPEISKLANKYRESGGLSRFSFPQPMLKSDDYDFSYSGLKTAVLYKLKEYEFVTEAIKEEIAANFEEAALSVIIYKTRKALDNFEAKTLIVGGGVVAN
ncbi:MAG: tRNA (adenosine(37)-N6)-threonylcarbamoyltransferase complex transferase subunit TsaD, partial [bacterium]|nr:tRNA (adenosine(37)-N6)-threonylcarbamoyltransferase complex transferase subunit TsaD [bacterium]